MDSGLSFPKTTESRLATRVRGIIAFPNLLICKLFFF
jgi:hypothetical protein